jgi:hypothetical protein
MPLIVGDPLGILDKELRLLLNAMMLRIIKLSAVRLKCHIIELNYIE